MKYIVNVYKEHPDFGTSVTCYTFDAKYVTVGIAEDELMPSSCAVYSVEDNSCRPAVG